MSAYEGEGRRALTAMLYCHDTFGLGHLRRTLAIAEELRRRRPDVSALIATGSPLAHAFRLPPGIDYLKLPAVAKTGADRCVARPLPLTFDAISRLRRDLLDAAAQHLRPDLLIVDNVPGGLAGELVPALRALQAAGATRLVLGLRDVIDEPGRVRRAWTRDGSYELLDEVYDRILVYGQEDIFDAASAYGFSPATTAKTRYVGYLRRPSRPSRRAVEGRPFVLVTVGGGEDGEPLLRAALAAHLQLPGSTWLLVTGPFLPSAVRADIAARAGRLPGSRVVDFVDDLPSHIAAADVVVSMAGYNTVCELLAAGRRAVLVPRVEPRLEQLLRARALERRGLVRIIDPEELTPPLLARHIGALLRDGHGRSSAVDFGGLERTGEELDALLDVPGTGAIAAGGRA